jgi:hypothetical protein
MFYIQFSVRIYATPARNQGMWGSEADSRARPMVGPTKDPSWDDSRGNYFQIKMCSAYNFAHFSFTFLSLLQA